MTRPHATINAAADHGVARAQCPGLFHGLGQEHFRAGLLSPTTYATSRFSPRASSRASTTASRTPAWCVRRASICRPARCGHRPRSAAARGASGPWERQQLRRAGQRLPPVLHLPLDRLSTDIRRHSHAAWPAFSARIDVNGSFSNRTKRVKDGQLVKTSSERPSTTSSFELSSGECIGSLVPRAWGDVGGTRRVTGETSLAGELVGTNAPRARWQHRWELRTVGASDQASYARRTAPGAERRSPISIHSDRRQSRSGYSSASLRMSKRGNFQRYTLLAKNQQPVRTRPQA
jgi:hypothetical protein